MDISVHQLTVEAALTGNPRAIFWAMMADPLTNSVLTLDQMEKLSEELLLAHKEYHKALFPLLRKGK
jgi:alpha-galactosidase/6-phospho-beta-glucosidase family protein